MFNKRKEIVIGETYLYDVLNETNLAPMTNLVTVVKKSDKNRYVVISPNGDVFESDAKYLTPYVDPEKAGVIRCHYGTTEFNQLDVKTMEIVDSALNLFRDVIKDIITDSNELFKMIDFTQQQAEQLKNKVKRYAEISQYKESIQIIKNVFDEVKGKLPPTRPLTKDTNEFNRYFDNVVNDYLSHKLSIDEFIEVAIEVIKENFPEVMLINDDDSALTDEELEFIVEKNASIVYDKDCIAIVFSKNDDDEWVLKGFYRDETTSDKEDISEAIRDFLDGIYPDAGEEYIPKYRPAIFTVRKSGEQYE